MPKRKFGLAPCCDGSGVVGRKELDRLIKKAKGVFVKVNWTLDDFNWVACTKSGLRDSLRECSADADESEYLAEIRFGDLYVG